MIAETLLYYLTFLFFFPPPKNFQSWTVSKKQKKEIISGAEVLIFVASFLLSSPTPL
jgi:hypothetical protein